MTKSKVLFRADGNSRIGLGHVYRSLALAEIISVHFDFTFAIREPLPGISTLIKNAQGDVIPLREGVGYDEEAKGLVHLVKDFEIVVLDGYSFTTDYQRILRQSGSTLICIDDIHNYFFVADAIINHAGGTTPQWYKAEPYTRFFLGTRYCLVRKIFREVAKNRPASTGREDAVFISIGGADTDNHTLRILQRCESLMGQTVYHVVTGEAYRHADTLQQYIDGTKLTIQWHSNLSAEQMLELMKKCRSAVCAPSGVAYEYLCVGGELYLHQTADNQTDLKKYLLDSGLAFSFDQFPVQDPERVRTMLTKQATEFNGSSEDNLREIFLSFHFKRHCRLRKVNEQDLPLLFRWANDRETRRLAFNAASISLEDHQSWFGKKLNDPNAYLYIFEYKNTPVGQIRFDVGAEAVITYAIDEQFRGKGLGTEIIREGILGLRHDSGFNGPITGYVKKKNHGSNAIFLKLGFYQETDKDRNDSFKYTLNYAGDKNWNQGNR